MSQLIECPYCHRQYNAAMRKCPFCSAGTPAPQHQGPLLCPRCRVELQEIDYRGEGLDQCPLCYGLWLERREFDFLTSERDAYCDPVLPREYNQPPLVQEQGYLPCACCSGRMVRQNFRRISGVLYDFCIDHGVWLDVGELEAIRTFVANGGLTQSQDMVTFEHHMELKQLAETVSKQEFTHKMLNFWNPRYWFFRNLF